MQCGMNIVKELLWHKNINNMDGIIILLILFVAFASSMITAIVIQAMWRKSQRNLWEI